jgi:hypothetical protein
MDREKNSAGILKQNLKGESFIDLENFHLRHSLRRETLRCYFQTSTYASWAEQQVSQRALEAPGPHLPPLATPRQRVSEGAAFETTNSVDTA